MQSASDAVGDTSHVLLAGDTTDLPEIRRILETLPATAYGQVYLEIVSPIQIRRIARPAGVSLTWLRRDLVPHGHLDIAPRGELLRSAVAAWATEWMPEAPADGGDRILLWVGCTASARVGSLYRELASKLSTDARD